MLTDDNDVRWTAIVLATGDASASSMLVLLSSIGVVGVNFGNRYQHSVPLLHSFP